MPRKKVWLSKYAWAWVDTPPAPRRIKPLVRAKVKEARPKMVRDLGTGNVHFSIDVMVPMELNKRLRQLAYYDDRPLTDLVRLGLAWVVTEWAASRNFKHDLTKMPLRGCGSELRCWMSFYRPIPRQAGWWKDLLVLGFPDKEARNGRDRAVSDMRGDHGSQGSTVHGENAGGTHGRGASKG